jgi:hypothetical protein
LGEGGAASLGDFSFAHARCESGSLDITPQRLSLLHDNENAIIANVRHTSARWDPKMDQRPSLVL